MTPQSRVNATRTMPSKGGFSITPKARLVLARPLVLATLLTVAALPYGEPIGGLLRAQDASVPNAGGEPGPIRTIVLDPGHGGDEVGAIGKTGIFEKDLSLDIARRLQRRLVANERMEVILTREDDRTVPLRERTAIANHASADLYISIHLNSSRRRSAHGTETYFLALTASDEEAMRLAQTENLNMAPPAPGEGEEGSGAGEESAGGSAAGSTTPGGTGAPAGAASSPGSSPGSVSRSAPSAPAAGATPGLPPNGADQPPTPSAPSDLEMVLWGMAQSEHIVRSSRLAEVIQAEMNRLLNVPTRGVKQAPFTVLMGATMPAVLVEVAFLSNESEETLLASEDFRERVAAAMESALVRFRDETEGALTAAPGGGAPTSPTP